MTRTEATCDVGTVSKPNFQEHAMFTAQIVLLAAGSAIGAGVTAKAWSLDPQTEPECDLVAEALGSAVCSPPTSSIRNFYCPVSDCCNTRRTSSFYDVLKVSWKVEWHETKLAPVSPVSGPPRIKASVLAVVPPDSRCGTYFCDPEIPLQTGFDSAFDEDESDADEFGDIIAIDTGCVFGERGVAYAAVNGDAREGSLVGAGNTDLAVERQRALEELNNDCVVVDDTVLANKSISHSSTGVNTRIDFEPVSGGEGAWVSMELAMWTSSNVRLFDRHRTDCGATPDDCEANRPVIIQEIFLPIVIEYETGVPTQAVFCGRMVITEGGIVMQEGAFQSLSASSVTGGFDVTGTARCCILSDPKRIPVSISIPGGSLGGGSDRTNPGDINGDGIICWNDLGMLSFMIGAGGKCCNGLGDLDQDDDVDSDDYGDLWAILNGRPCPADMNCDGFLDFFDYDLYLHYFEVSRFTGAADFNGDGAVDFFDYGDFVEAFENGCD